MERRRHIHTKSEFSSPRFDGTGGSPLQLSPALARGWGGSPVRVLSIKRPYVKLDPIPSHTSNVVKIKRQMSRFQSYVAASCPVSPKLFSISIPTPQLPLHLEQQHFKDAKPLWDEDKSERVNRKFNSPYTSDQENAAFERKDTAPLTEVLSQMSSGVKQLTTDNFDDDYSHTDSVAKYHEFKFKLMTEDPILQGVNGTEIRWKAGETLGQGTMGQVIRAFNVDTGELFAVKRLLFNQENDGQNLFVKMLENEVAILSKLAHPKIVQYLGSERVCGSLCTYLEYLSGGSLTHLLNTFGPLPENIVKVYLRQVLEGLEFLHSNGVVHRDLKCANILVDGEGVVKLSDFGCSAKYESSMQQSNLTSLKGTILWMAPEVVKQGGYGRKADIWSLGCTVLEMLTCKPPWPPFEDLMQAVIRIGLSNDSPALPPTLSGEASDFISTCLQRDPALRPSASALLRHPFVLV